jgi:FemAB-related protein (PEP-CTERM system-associated)
MEQTVTDLRPLREVWNAYVESHPRATQYHRYEWLEVIRAAFGHEFFPLVARNDGEIRGVLPLVLVRSWLFGRRLVSLPFVNYGGVLADAEGDERLLWQGAEDLARKSGAAHLEARHLRPHPFATERRQHKATMILHLEHSIDGQWSAFNAKLRNQIRKAERSGLSARSAGPEELPRFYQVFARCMRDLGTPVYGRRFFAEILRAFPASSRIFLVESGSKAVAAAIALSHRETLEVPWAGSLREYRSHCANNLLYWKMISQAIHEGFHHFDFGRSTPGDGPYRFKEQWGAQPTLLHWEYWLPAPGKIPDLSPKNDKFSAAIQIWKRLPLPVTNWLGPALVRGIP